MESIDYKGIAELIKRGEVNYVSFVMTPWHLIGAKAAIQFLKNEGVVVKPLIISEPHPDTGFSVIKDDQYSIYKLTSLSSRTPILKYISFLFWCWRTSAENNAQLYFANPWYGKFKRLFWILSSYRSCFKILIFEEGIGTYVRDYYSIRHYVKDRNILQLIQIKVDLFLSKRYINTGRIVNLNPLKYEFDGRPSYNEPAIKMYKRALNIEPVQLNEKRIVFLTQEIDEEIYRVVNDVSQFLTSYGMDVYIKAHPRFPIDTSKLTCKVTLVDHTVAIESLLKSMGTKTVISFNTTSLVSLRYLYDVTTISLLHFVNDNCCQGLFNCQGKFNKWFESSFSNLVLFPNDINELRTILGA